MTRTCAIVRNVAHLCLDGQIFLNPINVPRQAILTQTSSISAPDQTFIVGYAKDHVVDKTDIDVSDLKVRFI